jgi:hypothetical protein
MKSKTSSKGFGKATIDTSKEFDIYKVIEVDNSDNTVCLINTSMKKRNQKRGLLSATSSDEQLISQIAALPLVGTTAWCKPDAQLKNNTFVRGTFEFDPKKSEKIGRVPCFTVTQVY